MTGLSNIKDYAASAINSGGRNRRKSEENPSPPMIMWK
jgi:hypothetical protein